MSAFIITRIQVGDYESWRPMFDQDRPRARALATSRRLKSTCERDVALSAEACAEIPQCPSTRSCPRRPLIRASSSDFR